VSYSRKSTKEEGARKSIDDQNEVNQETAEEWGLPLLAECVFSEAEGMGGNLWYEGGGASGVIGDNRDKKRTRPILTQIIRGVVFGRYKCIIVYSLDRLWRDVGLCAAMIDVLNQYGCLLYDENGYVDTVTPDGHNSVMSQAAAASHQRRIAQVASPRGVRKSRQKGKRVSSADCLGFRNAFDKKNGVLHIPAEQDMVNRIFRLFDSGDGRTDANGTLIGPLTTEKIAQLLMDEGYLWLPDLWEKRAIKRVESTEAIIYMTNIRHVLQDCRYQGRQPHQNQEWSCPAFLKSDGEPVVPTAIYERVQAKFNTLKRGSNATRNSYALSGLLRCGLCGQTMSSGTAEYAIFGEKTIVPVWKPLKGATWCWCTHKLPTIQQVELDNYINDVLAPLLLADIQVKSTQGVHAVLQNQRAEIERLLKIEEHRFCNVLPTYMGTVPPAVLGEQYKQCEATIARLKSERLNAERSLCDFHAMEVNIRDIANVNSELRRDAIRSVLRWVAVLPEGTPYICNEETGHKRVPNDHVGRVVFLTVWGTLHTSLLHRIRADGQRRRVCGVCSAAPEQFIDSVRNFPDPEAFISGLVRAYEYRKHAYTPAEMAPGYYENSVPTATFTDVTDD